MNTAGNEPCHEGSRRSARDGHKAMVRGNSCPSPRVHGGQVKSDKRSVGHGAPVCVLYAAVQTSRAVYINKHNASTGSSQQLVVLHIWLDVRAAQNRLNVGKFTIRNLKISCHLRTAITEVIYHLVDGNFPLLPWSHMTQTSTLQMFISIN